MRILKYEGKLVEEVSYVENKKVVFLRYIRDEDKPHCVCGRALDKTVDIVEDSPLWKERISGVETI